ncbi:MAG TPA: uroporphyrinogen decarboxylase family protein [Phycisphaerae bacterium]|nr:uroporphyrinogen decarboxylase family protein [Phycisphaerae bacterium]
MLSSLPKPKPSWEDFAKVLRREDIGRVPLVELAIAEEVLADLNGRPLIPRPVDDEPRQLRQWAADRVNLWRALGYDYYRVRAEIPFVTQSLAAGDTAPSISGERIWVDEHQGVIQSSEDFERYPWPTRKTTGFSAAEAAIAVLPEGMGAIGFSGGVLEWASNLLGLENLMLMLYDRPELVRQVVDRVGRIILEALEVFCSMDRVFAIWLGDDMGFKTSTLIRPEQLREYILPWHKRYADLAHRTGRLFLLHSCGHVEAVMPDLINEVRIDAKHSFEDVIVPVEEFKRRWGDGVAVLGGVDVDLLSRRSPQRVGERTLEILEACAGGGYACGSGNSVTNYVPTANFHAMIETVHQFNGRM